VFGEFYRDPRIFEVARELGIDLVDGSSGASEAASGAAATPPSVGSVNLDPPIREH
jgi:hypothetical protein